MNHQLCSVNFCAIKVQSPSLFTLAHMRSSAGVATKRALHIFLSTVSLVAPTAVKPVLSSMSSIQPFGDLPLLCSPSTLPWISSFSRQSWRMTWPKNLIFLIEIYLFSRLEWSQIFPTPRHCLLLLPWYSQYPTVAPHFECNKVLQNRHSEREDFTWVSDTISTHFPSLLLYYTEWLCNVLLGYGPGVMVSRFKFRADKLLFFEDKRLLGKHEIIKM